MPIDYNDFAGVGEHYYEEGRVFSQETIRQDSIDQVATMLDKVALGLFGIFIIILLFEISPIRITDPAWMLKLATSLAQNMLFPLAGLLMYHIAAAFASPNHRVQARRRSFGNLALLAAFGYLLLIPLIGFANWRGSSQIKARQETDVVRIKKSVQFLTMEIKTSTSSKQLQERLKNNAGPTLPDSRLNDPLPQLQKEAIDIINQASNYAKIQARTTSSPEVVRIYWQSFKLVLLALVSAFCFASVTW